MGRFWKERRKKVKEGGMKPESGSESRCNERGVIMGWGGMVGEKERLASGAGRRSDLLESGKSEVVVRGRN